MDSLLFIATFITLLVLSIRLIVKLIKRKQATKTVKYIAVVAGSYLAIWSFFYLTKKDIPTAFGTDICFDDWCATITKVEQATVLKDKDGTTLPKGCFLIAHIKMSNHARGIAQKPSEPRVIIKDDNGKIYTYSPEGQKALENINGKQIPLDARLELHQSLETQLVFDIPINNKGMKLIIEEGPFITELLLHRNVNIFLNQ